jgi:L-ascorbate metabolism protein UlaG (beta-lactamase superfamily)
MRNPLTPLATLAAGILFSAGAILAQAPAPTATDDPIPTSNGNAVVHPIGHASVLITWDGKKIFIDPAPGGGGGRGGGAAGAAGRGGAQGRGGEAAAPAAAGRGGEAAPPAAGRGGEAAPAGGRGAAPAAQGGRGGGGRGAGAPPAPPSAEALAVFTALGPADLILVTHTHGDHLNPFVLTALARPATVLGVPQSVYDALPEPLKAQATIMANGDKSMLAGIEVQAVPAYNITPERRNHLEGVGNGYVLTLGGVRFYFAGDTEGAPELKALPNIGVAFIPMNLPFTQTPEAAAEWVRAMRPKIVYPYHYSNGDISAFVSGVGTASEVRLRKWY